MTTQTTRRAAWVAAVFGIATALPAFATSTLVISQFRVRGPASASDEFVELYNAGTSAVAIGGYKLRGSNNAGTVSDRLAAFPAGATINPGCYYLVTNATPTTGYSGSVPGDATYTTGFSDDGGIALTKSDNTLVDAVGMSAGSAYKEGTPLASLGTTNADKGYERKPADATGNGTDTDDNSSDFVQVAPTHPRNSASPCGGGGTTPTNPSATGNAAPASVVAGASTTLTVTVTPGANPASSGLAANVDLSPIGGSSTTTMTDAGGNVFTFTTNVSAGTTPGAKSLNVTVTDAQSRSGSATIALTVTQAPVTIMAIQGHGATSPMAGQTVTTSGIVTAINNATSPAKAFFIQDPNGDNDPTTSDGLYVYKGSAPGVVVGDSVTVTGKVTEYNGTTELTSPVTVTVNSHGNALPAAFDLNANPLSDDYTTGVCMGAGTNIHPLTDGFQAAKFACLDGMLVSFNNATIVAATGGSGGGGNAPDNPQYFYASLDMPRELRAPGIVPGDPGWTNLGLTMGNFSIPVYSGHPNVFEVYYGLGLDVANLPDVGLGHGIYNVGQTVGVAQGVVQGFQFTDKNNNYAPTSPVFYEIYPLAAAGVSVSGTAMTLPVPVATPAPGTLTVGTQNGLHFFNAQNDGVDSSAYTDACLATEAGVDISHNVGTLATPLEPGANDTCPTQAQYDTRLSKMSLQIRTVLKAPVVQVLQEIENLGVLTNVADKIHSDDPTLTYRPFLFAGNDPQGINIGILAQDGVTVGSVSQLALGTTTNACSGGGSCLLNDRPPVLLDATWNGYHFRVLAIYDRSLGSLSEKAYVGQKRRAQAEQVAKIVQALQSDGGTLGASETCSQQVDGSGTSTNCSIAITGSSTIPLVVIGDFNANEFSDGYVDVTGTIMGTVDTDPAHSIYPPTAGYVPPSPTLVNAVEPTLDPATHPLDWNPNYSYSFDGISEEIDQILVTRRAWQDFVRISHARGNADVSSASPDINDGTTPRRLSDHDGQVITFVVDRIFANGFDGAQ